MPNLTDEVAINTLALHERSIVGVRNSYDFAKNPNSLMGQGLPAVIHFPSGFSSKPRAHHNVWENTLNITSVVFVAPRQSQGGNLAYIENDALPYADKWRQKFQEHSVIESMLAATGSVKCYLTGGTYSVGAPLLQFAGTDYIGWVIQFQFVNA